MENLWDLAPESERRECDTCGLTWFERHGHECPKPWPYEMALAAVQTAEAMRLKGSPMIVSPRQKAAIRMGLDSGPSS